jgi:tetratricopeptide (TPR) repeat protein
MNTMKGKRLLFITVLLSVLVYLSGCSDKMYVNRALTWAESGTKLDTALKSVNRATKLEETKNWPKTYYVRGYVYQKLYETKNSEFKDIVEKPLFKAFDNYKKSYDMDEKGTYKGSIDAALFTLHKYFINEGVNGFKNSDYESAFSNFKYAIKVSNMPVFDGHIDTAIIYNAGIAAQNMQNWETAAEYYQEAANYGYQGARTYLLMNNAYLQAGDTLQAVNALKEGFEKYPTNNNMIGSLVNYYLLNSDNPEKALKYLDKAIEEYPDQAQYYSAKAQVYDKVDKIGKAKENYHKALDIDSRNYMALYNLGVLYFNEGVDMETKANKTKKEEEYKKLKRNAEDKFLEALPYMEKANEIKPKDMAVLKTLKTLYYRLRVKKKEYLDKYKQVNKKIKQMQQSS